jgi:hypothetical protein
MTLKLNFNRISKTARLDQGWESALEFGVKKCEKYILCDLTHITLPDVLM